MDTIIRLAVGAVFAGGEILLVVGNAFAVEIVLKRLLDGFLCQDGAVELVGGQTVQRPATALLVSAMASWMDLPLIISVAVEEEAMALPQPRSQTSRP